MMVELSFKDGSVLKTPILDFGAGSGRFWLLRLPDFRIGGFKNARGQALKDFGFMGNFFRLFEEVLSF